MKPSTWMAPSGKVHRRRLRFWVGTAHETPASPDALIMLCGMRPGVVRVSKKTEVTCGVCLKAGRTGAGDARHAATRDV